MKIFNLLIDKVNDEIDDAHDYVKRALCYKEDYPALSKTFYELSLDELKHMERLHGEVTKLIEEYRRAEGEPPEAMLAVYNYLHDKMIARTAEVKTMQGMYSGK